MKRIWNTWKYAIGSFEDKTTKPYDNHVAFIRTFWVFLNIITCIFIIAGNSKLLGIW